MNERILTVANVVAEGFVAPAATKMLALGIDKDAIRKIIMGLLDASWPSLKAVFDKLNPLPPGPVEDAIDSALQEAIRGAVTAILDKLLGV